MQAMRMWVISGAPRRESPAQCNLELDISGVKHLLAIPACLK
jgi:hypothetical protein